MNKFEIGKQRITEVLGVNADDILAKFEKISPDFARYIVEFAYGDLYARKGLDDKTREVAAVAAMIGQGQAGFPLRTHLKAMLNVGWTKEEVLELIIFSAGYAGFPSAVEAIHIAAEVFAECE